MQTDKLRRRQKLGKYRIEKRLAVTNFAAVYAAYDTILGVRVALKIPHTFQTEGKFPDEFRKEVRLAAKLDHPHILPIKDAGFIDKTFVIVSPLGIGTLADRIGYRLAADKALDLILQMLDAVAFAHGLRVIHCDIKPENFILFPDSELRLADFGIAKIALRTLKASGSGTLGYVAPEQAMGRPGYRSDVFSLGLIAYRMLSGKLPEWPFTWPGPGYDRLRQRMPTEFIDFLKKSIDVTPSRRFANAGTMLAEYERILPRTRAWLKRKSRRRKQPNGNSPSWHEIRWRQFRRRYGKQLETRFSCRKCEGPVAESMQACPWCGADGRFLHGETQFPAQCPRCDRGMKLDWHYCAWCYGAKFDDAEEKQYSDKRYVARCSNARCSRRELMPHMRYCPWCRNKVRKRWKLPDGTACGSCGNDVLTEFWGWCPWCADHLEA
ncbi:MAG: protein kinase [Gammaproteobacteria bacterium]|nr:protein kinase [Gammaproteobacteria bacterium]NNF59919.1 protein kinase [Gammaproteobacteria bacterium]NNM21653.1 protein kinase [Gammaproteobacteria bacterium]